MGYKNVCVNCKRVENLGTDRDNFVTGNCPHCSEIMNFVNHKFRPPKKSNEKSWKVVKLLIENGFVFQRIKDKDGITVNYPTNIEEAKDFIIEYKDQKINNHPQQSAERT